MVTETVQRVTLELHPKQDDFVSDKHPFACFCGGVGSGKTRAGAVKALDLMIRYPGIKGIATAPTFKMLTLATIPTVKEIFPGEPAFVYFKGDNMIQGENGSQLFFMSTDDPEHLRGPSLGFFWMDEAALGTPNQPNVQHDAFLILQARLRQQNTPLQGWVTTTPKGFNWIHKEFVEKKREDYILIPCSARENPFLPWQTLKRLEDSYSDVFAQQEIEGLFVIVSGTAFFDQDQLKRMYKNTIEPEETRGGLVSIWESPAVDGKYIAGGDLAWGTTGAFSCLTIIDWQTGVQVAEIYGRPERDEMAQASVELCRQYNNAFVGMENNSEGMSIVQKMILLGYKRHMYYSDWKKPRSKREKPGWHTDSGSRPIMLEGLREAVEHRAIVPRCRDAIDEMMMFERAEDGSSGPIAGRRSDHVMALAIAWQMRAGGFARFKVDPVVFLNPMEVLPPRW